MGYKIVYGKSRIEKIRITHHRKLKLSMIKLSAAVIAAVALLLWPKGRAWAKEAMVPGDNEVTSKALQGLVTDLGDGVALSDALQVFCGEILDNG